MASPCLLAPQKGLKPTKIVSIEQKPPKIQIVHKKSLKFTRLNCQSVGISSTTFLYKFYSTT